MSKEEDEDGDITKEVAKLEIAIRILKISISDLSGWHLSSTCVIALGLSPKGNYRLPKGQAACLILLMEILPYNSGVKKRA